MTCCISLLSSMLRRAALDHHQQEPSVAPGCIRLPAPPSSSGTQRGLIPADRSKFHPAPEVPQQQRLAASTDDFSSKPGASSPTQETEQGTDHA